MFDSIRNTTELSLIDMLNSRYLFKSDFHEIKNWTYDLKDGRKLSTNYNDCFCIVLVKRGNFIKDLSAKTYNMHSGHLIVEKSDYEYRLRPAAGECSILNFKETFYRDLINDYGLKKSYFFSNANLFSLLLNTSPEIDYLHHQIMRRIDDAGKLEMDTLVLGLVQQIAGCITNQDAGKELLPSTGGNRMSTIETAKQYMNEKFMNDISLGEVAARCHTSPFHFSRIFKKITSYSPHQYLLNVRLKHAEMLLRNTPMTVTDICFSSGFNSIEHFATMFRQKYNMRPGQLRRG